MLRYLVLGVFFLGMLTVGATSLVVAGPGAYSHMYDGADRGEGCGPRAVAGGECYGDGECDEAGAGECGEEGGECPFEDSGGEGEECPEAGEECPRGGGGCQDREY